MIKPQNSRFLYRAQGLVAGGFLLRPAEELIAPEGGSATLAITGGYNSSRISNFRHRDILSLRSGYTMVTGRKSVDGERFETVVTSVVENLNIMGVVTVDRIVARVSSFHPDQDNAEPSITPLGSHFQGLRVNGRDVSFTCLADDFKGLETYSGMECKLREDKQLRQQVIPGNGWDEKGMVPLSLVRDLTWGKEECAAGGNRLEVEGFGVVHLAELIASRHTRRLTMLRVELGCAADGDVQVCGVEGDGHRLP